MQRRKFLQILATAAALPAVAPLVDALAPLVHVASPRGWPNGPQTTSGVLTFELLEDFVRRVSIQQPAERVIYLPRSVFDSYHAFIADERRRFDVRTHTYRP